MANTNKNNRNNELVWFVLVFYTSLTNNVKIILKKIVFIVEINVYEWVNVWSLHDKALATQFAGPFMICWDLNKL